MARPNIPVLIPIAAALFASLVATACARSASGPLAVQVSSQTDLASPQEQPPRRLAVTPEKAQVGEEVEVRAEGLAPGKRVSIVWETVSGGWIIEDYYHFKGKQYRERSFPLVEATVSSEGILQSRFPVPEDYGGVHNVSVLAEALPLAKGGLEVTQKFEMSPGEGPVGTIIELRATGLGWRTMESTWVVNWDNHLAGWISAADTGGSAVARFRAAGPPGDHEVRVYTGYQGQGYLNHEQAPNAYLPRPHFVFRTTPEGELPASYSEPYPVQPVLLAATRDGIWMEVTPTQGPVLTPVRLTGSGFAAGRSLDVTWSTWVGSRVTETGFAPKEEVIGTVLVSTQGTIDAAITIPDDLGGLHSVVVKDGGEELARVSFAVETSIVDIFPTSGPSGTPVTIHLKGVGWTEYDNIYVVNYDNAYMGYACGFNSQGDVVVNFTAAGAPGVHLIDFYPGLYQGPEKGQQLYRLPQLTYKDDHPGNKIPALRFAFEVTP